MGDRPSPLQSDTFDWLLSLRAHPELREWLLPSAHGLRLDARVLVVGCGDSTLSEDLADCGCTRVVGVDIEERCIAAARARTVGRPSLSWAALDLAAAHGLPAQLGRFNLALDKGTLDAIVCAGDDVACRAVWNVRAVLEPNGVLVVVTLHRDGTVQRLVEPPALGFAVVASHALRVGRVFDGKVLVCRAGGGGGGGGVGSEAGASFAEYRAQVAAAPREDATPLLTPEREASLRLLFAMRKHSLDCAAPGAAAAGAGTALADVHALIFSEAERSEYALADFAQDVAAFEPSLASDGAAWTADDAVRFLLATQ
ncbi:hypothetical protein KFE25_003976 [Diacronema lutheri]|uniref:Methyltransferase type 12 domain-containing protein n=1 Tax=Diacronema lutheri TaxID=2081491 RepID=A0A8J6CDM8_DIALT|nr:hypothetical protein KFE25_003976 [Diacronema lutheri]